MSLERAKTDVKRFSQGEFSAEISLTSKDGVETATVKGLISKHHLQIDPDTGNPVNAKNVHVSIVESVILDDNPNYPTRNSDGEIDLFNHLIEFADASGTSFKFRVDEVMPSETFGLIVFTLGQSI